MENIKNTLEEMGINTTLNKSLKENYKKALKDENFKDNKDMETNDMNENININKEKEKIISFGIKSL